MSRNLWTAELHEHPVHSGTTWFCVAPETTPLVGHPGRYPYNCILPDGRRAYGFTTEERAQRAADRANSYRTESRS